MDEKDYLGKIKQNRDELNRKNEEDGRAKSIVDAVNSTSGQQQDRFTAAIHDLMFATLIGKDPKLAEVSENLAKLFEMISAASDKFKAVAFEEMPKVQKQIVTALEALPSTVAEASKQPDLTPKLEAIITAIKGTGVKVDAPDLSPILTAINGLADKFPKPVQGEKADFSALESVMAGVKTSIEALRFPVANYVLPFKDASGKDAQVQLDGSGNLPIASSGATQYTDGGVPPAHPVGNTIEWSDGSNWQTVSTTKPLPVTASISTPSDLTPATQNITVVDSSSSSAAGANNQTIIIGTPTAGSAASFALSSIETIRVEVTGIWTGTIATETSVDGGTTWVNQGVHQGAYTTSSFTAGFVGGANVAGATNFRIRATAAITGTAVVKVIESVNTQSVYIANAAPAGNIISILNSSVATLLAAATYTGTGEDVSNFSEMRVTVFANVASATDGLSLQQSTDNSNWDVVDTYTIAASSAGQGKTFVVPRQARYFRVVYTNGGTNQATFRLSTLLNRTATAPSSNRPGDAYTNETDLVQGQSFLMGYNGTTWDRLRTTGTGVLTISGVLTAGSALIGKVGIDQTTPGTTNNVSLSASTGAGTSALIKDDPTFGDGVTSGIASVAPRLFNGTNYDRARGDAANGADVDVTRLPALVAGSAIIGKVSIDQTTPGTTNAVSANQGTAAALASGWPVLNGEASDTSGTFTNATQTTSVTASSLDGYGNVLISINGTFGTATAVFEGSDDGGTTWYGISEADRTDSNIIESGYTTLTNTSRAWQISNPGWDAVRVRSTAVASGTVNVRISPSAAPTSAGASVSIGVALPTGANTIGALTANQSVNVSQINAVTPLMGNGVTGTGSQRVTIASDNTAFPVNATLSAETTKVIGTVNQGTSPWVTSLTSTTITSEIPGVGATNLGKAEDAAHTSGDTGVFALAVRNDNLATTYGQDQDYSPMAVDLNGRVMVAQKTATATLSNVASSATSVTLLAANASRIGAQITNDSSALLYIKFGTTASTTSYTVVLAGAASAPFSYYEVPAGFTGRIDGIWASAVGNARCTEET